MSYQMILNKGIQNIKYKLSLVFRIPKMKTSWDHPRTWVFNEVCMLINISVPLMIMMYGLFFHDGPFWSYNPVDYPTVSIVADVFLVYFNLWLVIDLFFPVHYRTVNDLPLLLHHLFSWLICGICLFVPSWRNEVLIFYLIGLISQESFVYFALRRGSRLFRLNYDLMRCFYFGMICGYYFPHMKEIPGRDLLIPTIMLISIMLINLIAFPRTNAIYWKSKQPSHKRKNHEYTE